MSTITHKFTRPAAAGRVGSVGSLICTPSARRELEDETVLPEAFTQPLESDGSITLELDDTDDTWCWCIREDVPRGRTRWVLVDGDADYADLEDVDPASGDIKPPLPPIWKTYVDSAIALAVAAVQLVISTLAGRVTAAESEIDTKADTTALTAETAARVAADALKADTTALTAGLAGKQPLATMLTKIAALAATLTDGQLIKWDGALGEPIAMNPVGASRIAGARNTTGATTNLAPGGSGGSGARQTIALTTISVTNSGGRSVGIRFGASFSQTVAGLGSVFLYLRETTGAGADRKLCVQPLTGVATVGNQYVSCSDEYDIGVVTTTRTFELQAHLFSPTGQTPQASAFNSGSAPSWIYADAA